MEILDSRKVAETNFILMLDVGIGLNTNKIHAQIACNTSELQEKQIAAIVGYYAAALEAMAADPHANHDAISLLSEAERRQQLSDWNSTRVAFPSEGTIVELFEQQVERTPGGGCRGQRWCNADVCRVELPGQPVGPPPAEAWRWARDARRDLYRAVFRNGHRVAGHTQSCGCLRSSRSRTSQGAAGLHDGGRRSTRAAYQLP